MSTRRRTPKPRVERPKARSAHGRQRQRLIEACISALYIYGPSRTTVEKVVAIAKMSPGIVRFYFDSKAAMLVASLKFLAAEFEERVLLPVAARRSQPVAALESMIDLYLDPDIASPRKVSVWYSFWGEASSRQEYYDICGQKDESFAALVRELIELTIERSGQVHLDPDGIALGLIGALEIIWQDFAFRTERDIDRAAARRRCMGYLRSVFPGQFAPAGGEFAAAAPAHDPRAASAIRFAAWTYHDSGVHAEERAVLQAAWSFAGHEAELPRGGDFSASILGTERALLVRAADGAVHALRNSCPAAPHALVAERSGHAPSGFECKPHGLAFALDGRRLAGAGFADLLPLELSRAQGLYFVRSPAADRATGAGVQPAACLGFDVPSGLAALGPPQESAVAADWKCVIERWLEFAPPPAFAALEPEACEPSAGAAGDSIVWPAAVASESWTYRRYRRLVEHAAPLAWRRQFVFPNQLLEWRPDGLSVLQAVPLAPGRCVVRRHDFTLLSAVPGASAVLYLAGRLSPYTRGSMLQVAESAQAGLSDFGYVGAASDGGSPADWFRRRLAARLPRLHGVR